jgi:capsular polysaccharide export protein
LHYNTYDLLIEAVRARRRDLIKIAIDNEAIDQSELYRLIMARSEERVPRSLIRALNLYARNERVRRSKYVIPKRRTSRERPKIVLHIGSTKTGSTTLQQFMSDNRAELLRHGIWYPEVGLFWQKGRPHKQAGHAHFAPAAVKRNFGLRTYIEAGLELNQNIHTVVLSSEAFFLNPRAHYLADYFKQYPVEMVVYLRRQDEWANSQYAEFVAGGAVNRVSSDFDAWIKSEEVRNWLDYYALLERWRQFFVKDDIHVRIYGGRGKEDRRTEAFDIIKDFGEIVGIPFDEEKQCWIRSETVNLSQLPTAHVCFLREYNKKKFGTKEKYFTFIEEVSTAIKEFRQRHDLPLSKPWFLDNGRAAEIMGAVARQNEHLAREYFECSAEELFPPLAARPSEVGLLAEEIELVEKTYERLSGEKSARGLEKREEKGQKGENKTFVQRVIRRKQKKHKAKWQNRSRVKSFGKRVEKIGKNVFFKAGIRKKRP